MQAALQSPRWPGHGGRGFILVSLARRKPGKRRPDNEGGLLALTSCVLVFASHDMVARERDQQSALAVNQCIVGSPVISQQAPVAVGMAAELLSKNTLAA